MTGGSFTAVVSAFIYVDPSASLVISGGKFTVLNGIGLNITNKIVPIFSGVFSLPQGSVVTYVSSVVLIGGLSLNWLHLQAF